MKVGLYTLRMVDNPTGMANYSRCLSYAMRRVDPSIQIVLINPHPHAASTDWFRDFPAYHYEGVAPSGSRAGTFGRLATGLAQATRRLGLDIIHAPGNVAPFVGPRLGAKRVVTVHDVAPLVLPAQHSRRLRLVHATMIPPLRWTADAVLTDSAASARDIAHYAHLPPSKIHITPLGTNPPSKESVAQWRKRATDSGIGCPYFLAVGDVTPRKNLQRVLDAFRQVLTRRPDARLIVAGQSLQEDRAFEVAAAGLGDHVLRTGFVDTDTLHMLYAGARALVFPSLYEGFGLPVLEAMAHETAVITSNASSLPEVAGDAAIIVNPYDPNSIAAAMMQVLDDDVLVQSLVQKGRRRVQLFSWDNTARQTIQVYEEILLARKSRHKSRRGSWMRDSFVPPDPA